jgi:hypothetical protein
VHAGSWLKGDLHVHSTHSGDAAQIGDDIAGVIRAGESAGLDFMVISDHRTSACLTDPQFTGAQTRLVLIAGEEWGQPGHAGAVGLTRAPIYDTQDETQGPTVAVQKIQATLDDVHSMGGIWVLNHAIDSSTPWYWPVDRFDAVEVWNQSWALRNATDVTPSMLQAWASQHGLDQPGAPSTPPEALAAIDSGAGGGQNWQRLKLYEAHLNAGRHIAAVGGGDSHYLVLPGQPTTVVFASQPTRDAILEGMRLGRTMVMRAPDAPAVELSADLDNQGTFAYMIGDSVPVGHTVTFKVHVRDDLGGKVQLVENGQVVKEWPVTSNDFVATFTDVPAATSWYRVNVLEPLDLNLPQGSVLKALVLGTTSLPAWLQTVASSGVLGSFGSQVQAALNSGAPALLWLVANASQTGTSVSPGSSRYPRFAFTPAVSRYLNVAVHDPDYAMGVVTSPIWAQ